MNFYILETGSGKYVGERDGKIFFTSSKSEAFVIDGLDDQSYEKFLLKHEKNLAWLFEKDCLELIDVV